MKASKVSEQIFRDVAPNKSTNVMNLNPRRTNGKQTYQQDRIYDCNGRMPALTATLGNRFYVKDLDGDIRKLTIREQARLQTIPEWYDFSVVSDLHASKVIGNGWTIDVIKALLEGIKNT